MPWVSAEMKIRRGVQCSQTWLEPEPYLRKNESILLGKAVHVSYRKGGQDGVAAAVDGQLQADRNELHAGTLRTICGRRDLHQTCESVLQIGEDLIDKDGGLSVSGQVALGTLQGISLQGEEREFDIRCRCPRNGQGNSRQRIHIVDKDSGTVGRGDGCDSGFGDRVVTVSKTKNGGAGRQARPWVSVTVAYPRSNSPEADVNSSS